VSRDKSGQHDHIVQFYEGDDFLCERVASFLSDGVRQGEPICIIATDDHRRIFSEQLQSSGIDVEAALRAGRLVILDARETLSRFMVEKMPDWNKFKATIGSTIEALAGGSGAARVRIYGEMVDVLWRDGNPQAAIHLEELWNDLGNSCSFSLLCAYRMGNFSKEADGAHFQHICRTHSLVVPSESYPQGDEDGARLREVSSLQQRAKSLEFEIAHRKELEVELRTALRDLRASEEALRRSEAELKDFFENAAEGLHWIGAANKAELDMLGYSAEEYIGRPIAEFHADPEVIADMLARLARNETLHDYEVRLRCKDGSIRHVLINSNARWQDEKFLHSRCFSRDVTARKLAEAKLRAAEQERAQLLEREREARAEAEAASKAKDEFLAMLGHELRNPLSPIVTALQLMRLRGDLTASKERAVIERQVRHLVRLVDDLLDVSRITRGKIELHREHVEIADVVAKGVERSSPLLEQRKHHLVLDVPRGRNLIVNGDPARLAQVFSNLIANAAKYTEPGGRITISAARAGGSISVRVADDGVGIDPHLMPRIFDLFTQSEQTLDRSQGGLGLGLTIVRSLVELHGGKVTARSEGAGRGSEFTVELPPLEPTAFGLGGSSAPEDLELALQPAWRALRVLVVDDNEDAAMLVKESLQELGYEVREAHDGPSALAIAAEFRPHLGVVDIGLPVMDGYDLARRLTASLPGIRLIALTGYGQESDRCLSREAGFEHHLVKPLALETLAAILDEFDGHRFVSS
jgi:PAS domain S-box-containing protein